MPTISYLSKGHKKPSHFLNLHLNNIKHCSMVSMERTSGLQTAQSWGWGKMYKETSRAGIPLGGGGGGEHTFIFLVLKASRKVNMNLKDKLIFSPPIPEISKDFHTTHIRQQDSFNKK